jgi:rubredoxin
MSEKWLCENCGYRVYTTAQPVSLFLDMHNMEFVVKVKCSSCEFVFVEKEVDLSINEFAGLVLEENYCD